MGVGVRGCVFGVWEREEQTHKTHDNTYLRYWTTWHSQSVRRERKHCCVQSHTQSTICCVHICWGSTCMSRHGIGNRYTLIVLSLCSSVKVFKSSALRGLCYVKAFCCVCVCARRYLYQCCWSNSDTAGVGACGYLREEELVWCVRDLKNVTQMFLAGLCSQVKHHKAQSEVT